MTVNDPTYVQFLFRLRKDLKEKLQQEAEREYRSLTQQLHMILDLHYSEPKGKP